MWNIKPEDSSLAVKRRNRMQVGIFTEYKITIICSSRKNERKFPAKMSKDGGW